MKPYIYCLLLVLFVIPATSGAQSTYFSDQGNLRVDFRVDFAPLRELASEPLKTVFVRSYTEVPISFQFHEFLGEAGDEKTEETALRFRDAIASHTTYLQVWRGKPHDQPTLLWQKDITGSFAGVHMYRFPSSDADYFVAVVMTDGTCPDTSCTNDFFRNPIGTQAAPFAYDGFAFHINRELTLYSNLLFLPGIKGSRLYAGEPCSDDSCKQKLWEPLSDTDIKNLFLSDDGSSVRDDIFAVTGDVIDSVLLTGIYGSFIQHLNDMEDSMLVLDYEALAYDWRLSLPDLVTRGAEIDDRIYYASSTPNPALQESLKRLHTLTKSGKVSIIAHSNGGLLAKALVEYLGAAQATKLIDKIVLIGVPQAGAPQALGALLYGYREGIPWQFPFLVSPGVARAFGENAPMAYHLLPSDALIRTVAAPIISFNAEQKYSSERSAYGTTVDSFAELTAFLLAQDGGRIKPAAGTVEEANVLNPALLSYAADLHHNLDSWIPPAGIEVYQIAGWGVETVSGIEYYEECLLSFCKQKYRPTFTEEGDGVVPAESALLIPNANNVHTYWIDLREHQSVVQKRDHGTLLEIPEVRDLVEKIVASTTEEIPRTISTTEPEPSATRKFRLFLHSPLELQATDSNGNYSGPNPDGSWSENIPGSEYGVFGEVQFITLPADTEYKVLLEGYEAGTFTLEVQEIIGDEIRKEVSFVEIPTTENTEVHFELNTDASEIELQVDTNGDGIIDTVASPTQEEMSASTSTPSTPPSSKNSTKRSSEEITSTTTNSITQTMHKYNSTAPSQTAVVSVPELEEIATSKTSEATTSSTESLLEAPTLLQKLIQLLSKLFMWLRKFSSSLLSGMTA